MCNRLYLSLLFWTVTFCVSAQYTEIINSNRPGASISAFAVGKNVLQGEAGFFYERQEHTLLFTESDFMGTGFALRYGLFLEQLEITWEGVFQREEIINRAYFPNLTTVRTDFLHHTVGLKYLLYDPYKNPEKINVYSWEANHSFSPKDLIPAISLYAGVNLNFGDNPFWPGETGPSPRVTLATQNHFGRRWVLVTNLSYDRLTTDDPVLSYVVTLTHAFNNAKWSIFAEHQGFKSDAYGDGLFRGGAAYLIGRNAQVDASAGLNIKDTPSRWFGNVGLSYRLDFHKN